MDVRGRRPLDTSKCTVDGAPVPPGGATSAGVVRNFFDISERLGGESEGEGQSRLLKAREWQKLFHETERPAYYITYNMY